jgi:FtsZ-binding cell division protein ZapB
VKNKKHISCVALIITLFLNAPLVGGEFDDDLLGSGPLETQVVNNDALQASAGGPVDSVRPAGGPNGALSRQSASSQGTDDATLTLEELQARIDELAARNEQLRTENQQLGSENQQLDEDLKEEEDQEYIIGDLTGAEGIAAATAIGVGGLGLGLGGAWLGYKVGKRGAKKAELENRFLTGEGSLLDQEAREGFNEEYPEIISRKSPRFLTQEYEGEPEDRQQSDTVSTLMARVEELKRRQERLEAGSLGGQLSQDEAQLIRPARTSPRLKHAVSAVMERKRRVVPEHHSAAKKPKVSVRAPKLKPFTLLGDRPPGPPSRKVRG